MSSRIFFSLPPHQTNNNKCQDSRGARGRHRPAVPASQCAVATLTAAAVGHAPSGVDTTSRPGMLAQRRVDALWNHLHARSGTDSAPRAAAAPSGAEAAASEASPQRRVALVTGASKGIGLEIARKLGAVEGLTLILGCQEEAAGEAAADELHAAGCVAEIVVQRIELDALQDSASIPGARAYLEREFGRLDILINNAAICFNDPTLYGTRPHTDFQHQAAETVRVNFFGTLRVTQALLPLLRAAPSPRIVTIASSAGRLSILRSSPARTAEFTSPELTVPVLEGLLRQFVADVEAGVHEERGWPSSNYGMSKLGLIALTRVLARQEPALAFITVDPGFCSTDQNDHTGTRPAERGAVTPVWLALQDEAMTTRGPGGNTSGRHFFDEEELDWLST